MRRFKTHHRAAVRQIGFQQIIPHPVIAGNDETVGKIGFGKRNAGFDQIRFGRGSILPAQMAAAQLIAKILPNS